MAEEKQPKPHDPFVQHMLDQSKKKFEEPEPERLKEDQAKIEELAAGIRKKIAEGKLR